PQRLNKQIVPEKLQATVIDPSPVAPPAESCRLVKGLAPNDLQRLVALAEEKLPGLRFAVKNRETPSNLYWVYVPPQPSRLAAEKKQLELKNRGVSNLSVILEEGADKFAISLGFFDSEQLAGDYLQELVKRGVRSARMQMRENLLDKTQLEVRGPVEMLAKQLPEMINGQVAVSVGDCAVVR
ncbi:MAG: hypothetical protein NTY41_17075, partial [Proteobacteria bacterium]|nr:hypothetical protein [Pseudomonadota bacterium]